MQAIDNLTGSVLNGEVKGDQFIVQSGPEFDPAFEVYDMTEVSPVAAALIADAVEYPTELDNTFPDGDMEARAGVVEDIEEAAELARLQKLATEFAVAAVQYRATIDRTMAAIEQVIADCRKVRNA